jgi:hypothetical protein
MGWRMTRTLLLSLILLALGATPVRAQDAPAPQAPVIESVELTGLSRDQLSPGLRRDLDALAGTPLNREAATALAMRIEAERPDVIAAIREVPQPDGRVRVVFVVAHVAEDSELAENINSRYLVERVEIEGIDERRISQALRDDLQKLVGRRLEDDEADALAKRLKTEQPDYDVSRQVSRGKEPGHIRVVFRLKRSESSWWIPYTSTPSKILYHSDQGWSTSIHPVISGEHNQFGIGLVLWNNDDLVEEYSGFSIYAENREAGTRRLGLGVSFLRYEQEWRTQTLDAIAISPEITAPYEVRLTVDPVVTVALTRNIRFKAGISASELDPLEGSDVGTRHANAATFSAGFGRGWRPQDSSDTHPRAPIRHRLDATYSVRAGKEGLDSDLVYTRQLTRASYRFEHKNNTFLADFLGGHISGRPPLFERFTLGDSSTLRGWDKYDITPAGATRVVHQSLEYRYKVFAYFFDLGSVWSAGEDVRLRLASGVGIHAKNSFLTIGVPLNADRMRAVVILGVRF